MKYLLLIPFLLCGCVSVPNHKCAVLHFSHKPSIETQTKLAATTHDNPKNIYRWFDSGELGFVINTTNIEAADAAYAAAIADGAIEKPH